MSKCIGLLGGMSATSSQLYYAELCRLTQARCGGLTSPDLVLRSLDFAPIEQWMRDGEWDAISDLLIREAQMLERAGAEVIALATNTMHKVADRIQDHLTVSLLHIAEATAASLVRAPPWVPPLYQAAQFPSWQSRAVSAGTMTGRWSEAILTAPTMSAP